MSTAEKEMPEKLRKAIFNNPEWILRDDELLHHLIYTEKKYSSNKVVDIRDVLLQKVNSDFANLSETHDSTISAAYENFLGVSNLHKCIIKILDQESLLGLLDTLGEDIRKILYASSVELYVYGKALPDLEHRNWKTLSRLEMVKLLRSAKLSSKRIVSLHSHQTTLWKTSEFKSQNTKNCSEALLSLKTYLARDDHAVLLLGSENNDTFNEKNKTDYLTILAKVVSHQLHLLLTKQRSIDEQKK